MTENKPASRHNQHLPPFTSRLLLGSILFCLPVLLGLSACTESTPEVPVAATATATSSPPSVTTAATLPVIPLPAVVEIAASGTFELDSSTLLVATGAETQAVAQYFAAMLGQLRGFEPALTDQQGMRQEAVLFRLDAAAAPEGAEAYHLEVTPAGATISARAPAGLFYGAVTLLQLASADGGTGAAQIPALTITDQPRYAWRGLMLDVSRHFREVEEVKAILDQMALAKLNRFHWHLTDDQGWRVEIKQYPELTRIGGCRLHAGAAGRDASTGEPSPYCGWYTQEDIREVVRYAAERHIEVIPELDLPGHAQAAIAAYPELGVTGIQPPVSPDWGIHYWLFNPNAESQAVLENVLGELVELFPSTWVHLGGDEAVKDQWAASPEVQAQRRELGLEDDMALQNWFMGQLGEYLAGHGKRMIGWDEILEGDDLPQGAIVMSWRGAEGAAAAARRGHDTILSPAPHLYLDHVQTDADANTGGRLPVMDLETVYRFPISLPEDLAAQAPHLLGAQANLWTEHLRTNTRVQGAAFPRAAALAELLWTPPALHDWHGFVTRLAPQMARYHAMDFNASDAAFAVHFAVSTTATGQLQVTLGNQSGFGELHYTFDGSTPGPDAPLYSAPLEVTAGTTITAVPFAGGVALAAARVQATDALTLATRSSAELRACNPGFGLRLEDDAPTALPGRESERALLNVNVFDACWFYDGVTLDGGAELSATVGQLPFNFQLSHDLDKVKKRPLSGEHGALEVRLGSCDGELLASLSLQPALDRDGLTELAAALPARAGSHDLCMVFASGGHKPIWALDRVAVLPAAP